MNRPKFNYTYNIYTYALELERYCNYLEERYNSLCRDMKNLGEAIEIMNLVKNEKNKELENMLYGEVE